MKKRGNCEKEKEKKNRKKMKVLILSECQPSSVVLSQREGRTLHSHNAVVAGSTRLLVYNLQGNWRTTLEVGLVHSMNGTL